LQGISREGITESTRPTQFTVSVVVPAFNEAENLSTLVDALSKQLKSFHSSEILIVDDGSSDQSCQILQALTTRFSTLRYIALSRNFGHQSALKAGLDHCRGDLAISLDADMQHPPKLIPQMVERWLEGFDVVCTKRLDDEKTSYFKRLTALWFYGLINLLSETYIEPGSADFRLLDRKVIDAIRGIKERPVFLRGVIPWLGFRTYWISYTPSRRLHGESKYSLRKMLSLAVAGITSSTTKPLRFSAYLGATIALLSVIYGAFAVMSKIFFSVPLTGWTSLAVLISILGALQLLMLGVIGEYIGRILVETKARPNYVIRQDSIAQEGLTAELGAVDRGESSPVLNR
jgi:polyisoprenyl-phosphate glycosyltransferase